MTGRSFRYLLLPLVGLFYLIVRIRLTIYRLLQLSKSLPGIVISIGNLSVGGSGKSPITLSLAEFLQKQKASPAILSRGYRSGLGKNESAAYHSGQLVMPAPSKKLIYADEARMQSERLESIPVIFGVKRYLAAQRFLLQNEYKPSHWLLDDGFQHVQLARQLDLVCLDAASPFADGLLLPAGHLREPVKNLSRAHGFIFTRYKPQYQTQIENIAHRFQKPYICVPFITAAPFHVAGPHLFTLHQQVVRVVTAIANPTQFVSSLCEQGLNVTELIQRPDHTRLSHIDLKGNDPKPIAVITTEKDYWRDPDVFKSWGGTVYVAALEVTISDEDWRKFLGELYSSRPVK